MKINSGPILAPNAAPTAAPTAPTTRSIAVTGATILVLVQVYVGATSGPHDDHLFVSEWWWRGGAGRDAQAPWVLWRGEGRGGAHKRHVARDVVSVSTRPDGAPARAPPWSHLTGPPARTMRL